MRTSNAVRALGHVRRYSMPIDITPQAGETSGAPGALRPHLDIPVNPNHGLYAFFRKRDQDGKATHDPLEDDAGLRDIFGERRRLPSRPAAFDIDTLFSLPLRPRVECGRAPKEKLQGPPHPVVRSSERAQPHSNADGELSARDHLARFGGKCRKAGFSGASARTALPPPSLETYSFSLTLFSVSQKHGANQIRNQ
jgi:hypothetical protein